MIPSKRYPYVPMQTASDRRPSDVSSPGLDMHVSLAVKRMADFIISLALLLALAPIMLLIALVVMLESHGGAFFRQTRAGLRGRPFIILKFRSMIPGPLGPTAVHDPRLTRVGAFIRRTSLDELPQLLNVIKGDMSLVGPRPLLPETIRPNESLRLNMRPGITGLVAVNGRQSVPWDERMQLDCWYVQNWSLWLDIWILWRTIPVVLSQANVYDNDGESKARP
jgi:lipopolysaccharide/colanic/teichoic acid biosynthesis glycosyltransferase